MDNQSPLFLINFKFLNHALKLLILVDSLYVFGQELETYLIVEANEKLSQNNQQLIEFEAIISGM